MSKTEFKAESKRLLDLMIHSIYTHKEIFLRELISNASDALDKRYYIALSDENTEFDKSDFYIYIDIDKDARTLTLSDTGIGMSKEEMESNLGTIAKSGSFAFKKDNAPKDGVDIIGQFGVGFYSAFMVSDLVTVRSRVHGSEECYEWESSGSDGYSIKKIDNALNGTQVILTLKQDTEDENYSEYLQEYRIKQIVKKYSDFIKYPIQIEVTKKRLIEGSDKDYEDYTEEETLNSMVPIWRKNKNELSDEDYDRFYQDKHFGFDKPIKHIHVNVDGAVSYTALLYIPQSAPYDFYTKEYEKGLELYTNGVLIMQKCADLLPDHFSFVQGLVDSADLSLNISRELLQHDRQLKHIAKRIQDKVKSELLSLQTSDREAYEKFFESFGRQLKYGVYADWGAHKDILVDLLLFVSSFEKKKTTLAEYVGRMPEDQKYIYYATGENIDKIAKLPQAEAVADKGYEILYFTDDIDEFAIKILEKYSEKEFRSVSSGDIGFENDTAKEAEDDDKTLIEFVKETLKDSVKDVKLSARLKSHPVCLSVDGALSIEMEKVLANMPGNPGAKAEKVLELNPEHALYGTLKAYFNSDKSKCEKLSKVLYNQALLIEGLAVSDPVAYANDIYSLLV